MYTASFQLFVYLVCLNNYYMSVVCNLEIFAEGLHQRGGLDKLEEKEEERAIL